MSKLVIQNDREPSWALVIGWLVGTVARLVIVAALTIAAVAVSVWLAIQAVGLL